MVPFPLPEPMGPTDDLRVPRLGGFYKHRKAGYVLQVVSWVPNRGVGLLVQVHQFHRQFPRSMKIESEEQLRKISDEAIDGIWYVQALKALNGNGEAECPKTI